MIVVKEWTAIHSNARKSRCIPYRIRCCLVSCRVLYIYHFQSRANHVMIRSLQLPANPLPPPPNPPEYQYAGSRIERFWVRDLLACAVWWRFCGVAMNTFVDLIKLPVAGNPQVSAFRVVDTACEYREKYAFKFDSDPSQHYQSVYFKQCFDVAQSTLCKRFHLGMIK